MNHSLRRLGCVFALSAGSASAQSADAATSSATISLQARAGVPLRVYTLKRFSKRLGQPVHARLLEAVYSFDREVVPAGAALDGTVSRTVPITGLRRVSAILGGDFTPLRKAEVTFTSATLPDGRTIPLHTNQTAGLATVYTGLKQRAPSAANGGRVAQAKAAARDQVRARIDSVSAQVRSPDKAERLEEFLLAKLPWHPQWVRKGTRFDAELSEAVGFGEATVDTSGLGLVGTQPAPDSVVHTRLLTPVSSFDAAVGQKVQAMVSQPLRDGQGRLVLPEGTTLSGTVTSARGARLFHRGGKLRFAFDKVDLPEGTPRPAGVADAQPIAPAVLDSAEAAGKVPVKVDGEGGAHAVESKTRLIAPAIAGVIAARTMSTDRDRTATGGETDTARGGTLGGLSGFGLLGGLAARSSQTVGRALAFYGLAWQVYSAVVARGGEVEYRKDAAMDIRFGARPSTAKNPAGR